MKKQFMFLMVVFLSLNLYSSDKDKDDLLLKTSKYVDIYGMLSGFMAVLDNIPNKDDVDTRNADFMMANNGSRFGFSLIVPVGYDISLIGKAEMSLNFMQGGKALNLDSNDGTTYALFENNNPTGPIGIRHGFLGVDFGQFGKLTFGKQYSVYFDTAASWTNQFQVFGGSALAVFNAGTDGGLTGTGRPDQALKYIVKFFGVTVGAQLQADSHFAGIRTFSFGLSYDSVIGLSAGAAYNHILMHEKSWIDVPGYDYGDGQAFVAGLKFNRNFGVHKIYIAGTYAITKNSEGVTIPGNDTIPARLGLFNTMGVETALIYTWKEMISVYAGYNWMIPTNIDEKYSPDDDLVYLIDPDMKTNTLIAGVLYHPKPWAGIYIEGMGDFGKDQFGNDNPAYAVTLGMTLEFSTTEMIKSYFENAAK